MHTHTDTRREKRTSFNRMIQQNKQTAITTNGTKGTVPYRTVQRKQQQEGEEEKIAPINSNYIIHIS